MGLFCFVTRLFVDGFFRARVARSTPMRYSPQLLADVKEYFLKNYKESLSDEQAVERLDALSDLYEVMEKVTAAALQGDAGS